MCERGQQRVGPCACDGGCRRGCDPQRTQSSEPVLRGKGASRLRATLVRAGVAGGLAGAFVLAAMLAEPGPSSANQGVTLPVSPADESVDLRGLLGELRGRTHRIEIVAGVDGPTYRVLAADGRVVAEGLRADEVYTVDENLTVDRFGDSPPMPGGPLMLLDQPSPE